MLTSGLFMKKQQIENLANLKLAVDNAYDHMMITNPDGEVLYANKAAEKLTGYSFEEMKGHSPRLWGGQMDTDFYKNFWKTIKIQKKVFVGELHNKRKNGEVYFAEVRIAPVLDKNKKVKFFVGIERDITKEKEVDRLKTEFISLTSHQLLSPLTVMKGFLDLLSQERFGKLGKKQKFFVERIQSANKNMIDLVTSLLNITRIESGKIFVESKLIHLDELIQGIADELSEELNKKKQKLEISIPSKLPTVHFDRNLLRQVYLNLITNAMKYTGQKGTISVMVKANDQEIISQVSDNGCGIPKQEQTKVFQKFFRATNVIENEPHGTGLGLYLVKLITEMAKGKISFESEEGKGTIFTLVLPIRAIH
ncbi:MAG: sensor signal transduction histidine kinase [Parachlamydiales bacterium]|nr:sensor signal transduction histidine kinase [Parachlamydiales bacterium]